MLARIAVWPAVWVRGRGGGAGALIVPWFFRFHVANIPMRVLVSVPGYFCRVYVARKKTRPTASQPFLSCFGFYCSAYVVGAIFLIASWEGFDLLYRGAVRTVRAQAIV